jgi:hypothetical protein
VTVHKSFTSKAPTQDHDIEVNGKVFGLNSTLPGYAILGYITNASSGDGGLAAAAIKDVFKSAIVADQFAEWEAFVGDPANNIDLSTIRDIAEYIIDTLSGNFQGQSGTG